MINSHVLDHRQLKVMVVSSINFSTTCPAIPGHAENGENYGLFSKRHHQQ